MTVIASRFITISMKEVDKRLEIVSDCIHAFSLAAPNRAAFAPYPHNKVFIQLTEKIIIAKASIMRVEKKQSSINPGECLTLYLTPHNEVHRNRVSLYGDEAERVWGAIKGDCE